MGGFFEDKEFQEKFSLQSNSKLSFSPKFFLSSSFFPSVKFIKKIEKGKKSLEKTLFFDSKKKPYLKKHRSVIFLSLKVP